METPFPDAPLDLSSLSPSERLVMEHARSAMTAAEIAAELSLSEATVRTHLAHIYDKVDVRGRVELLSRLHAHELLPAAPVFDPDSTHIAPPGRTTTAGVIPPHVIVSALGAAVGGVLGIVAMPATAHTPLAVVVLPLVAGAPFAIAIARRPGGLDFFAAVIGVCGSILVALSLAAPLSCPAGEFSSQCTGPAVSPILLPGLGLAIAGLLIARLATLRRTARDHPSGDIQRR